MYKVLLFILFGCLNGFAQQEGTFRVRTVAFYNVENLFDVTNDTLIHDDERTPDGRYGWTPERYDKKIEHIAKVISAIGAEAINTSPDLIGLCEVENQGVLKDLVNHPVLLQKKYRIVHFDSPDERGIDVALLYKEASFLPVSLKAVPLYLYDVEGHRDYTRDQLVVEGLLDGERFYVIVNHWPSRSGGELKSRPYRIKAAQLNKKIIDSIVGLDNDAKIISMGDFNDDPINASFKKVLGTSGDKKDGTQLYNPMEPLFKKGLGSLAYRDKWNLFDQFFFTANLLKASPNGYSFWKTGIYAPDFIRNESGRYKGYPKRTYVGATYQGGYSDHFPVFLFLVKPYGGQHVTD